MSATNKNVVITKAARMKLVKARAGSAEKAAHKGA